MKRILIMFQSGIGDLIMGIPLIKVCISNLSESDQLIIYVDSISTFLILQKSVYLDSRIAVYVLENKWQNSLLKIFRYALTFRRHRPTIFLCPHSTNRFRVTCFSILVGSKITILPYSKIPLFVWALLITAILLVVSLPVLAVEIHCCNQLYQFRVRVQDQITTGARYPAAIHQHHQVLVPLLISVAAALAIILSV